MNGIRLIAQNHELSSGKIFEEVVLEEEELKKSRKIRGTWLLTC
jgi:hypothetical protein